jgi:CRP-like cAMP-binding protein
VTCSERSACFPRTTSEPQTARARTDVDLLWISEGELAQICYQNPGIAFYFLKLTTNRLLANASRALIGSEAAVQASSSG